MPDGNCPSDSDLRGFALGDLRGQPFERIADHVGTCETCESVLRTLDGGDDPLVQQLRNISSASADAVETVPHPLIVAAESAYASRSGGSSQVVLDAGRRMASELADGPCRLGKFELLEELGVGSFGYVFKALDTELDRTVAIKLQRAGPGERALG